jgi:hypothetical protein
MPSAVAAAASYAATTLGAASGGLIAGGAYYTGYAAGVYGLQQASQALIDKPDLPSGTGESLAGKLQMRKNPAQPHRIIYGKTKVGADLTFYDVNNGGKDLHMVGVFAGHPCQSIESVYLDDDVLNLDANGVAQGKYSKANVQVNKHLGDQTTADSELVNRVKLWTNDHVGYDKTYVYVRAQAEDREDHRELFSGMPKIKGVVKGKKDIFDPRDSSTGHSNNPALIINDFITSNDYGYGFDQSYVWNDDLKNSANICEEQVNNQNRYTCNGTFRDDARKDSVLRNLLTSMAGETTWSRGKQRILAGSWRAPIDTFNEDHLTSGIEMSTKKSRKDLYNTVRGTFSDPTQDWQPTSFPQVQEQKFVDQDDGVVIPKSMELKFTTNEEEAQRIARILLRQHRQQKSLSTTMNIEAFNTQPGDNIGLDMPRYDWTNRKFNIGSWNFKLEQTGDEDGFAPMIDMELRETNSSVFNDESVNATSLTSPAVKMS